MHLPSSFISCVFKSLCVLIVLGDLMLLILLVHVGVLCNALPTIAKIVEESCR